MEYQFIPFMLLTGLLATASFFDVAYRIIPNWICGAILLLGLIVNTLLFGSDGVLSSLAGMCMGLGIFLPFYIMRVMGAGDVKLMAAVGTYLGPVATINAIAWTVLVGGVLGLIFLARRMAPIMIPALIRYTKPGQAQLKFVPYGVAITAGALICQFQPIVQVSF
jgi:prepilin peptidase CpaA